MNQGLLDNRLNIFFEQESEQADISNDQWLRFIGDATKYKQQRPDRIVRKLSNYFGVPRLTTVAAVVAVLIVGGVSVWLASTWETYDSRGAVGPPGVSGTSGNPGSASLPAPRHIDIDWNSEVRGYVPGDSITIMVTIRNLYHEALVLAEVAVAPSQPSVGEMSPFNGKLDGGPNAVRLDIPELLPAGEKLEIPITFPPQITSNFATGKYSMTIDLRYTLASDVARENIRGTGTDSGTAFVILPPEGALIKTVQSGEAKEASGVNVTLVSVKFGAEETKISAVINLPQRDGAVSTSNDSVRSPGPAQPTSISDPESPQPAATAMPAATRVPRAPGTRIIELYATYRIDDEEWEVLWFYEKTGEDGTVFVEWTIGPIPKTAKTFDFSVTEMKIYPEDNFVGPWNWSIPITNP